MFQGGKNVGYTQIVHRLRGRGPHRLRASRGRGAACRTPGGSPCRKPGSAAAGLAIEGRPQGPGAAKLAPVTAPPLPTPPDKLPAAKLKAPAGFKVEVFAAEVPAARSIRIGDKGTVFVGSRAIDKVHAITETDGKRQVKAIITGLHRPNGLAFHKGTLYVAELSKVWRYDNIEANLDHPKPTLLSEAFPKDEPHGWKFIAMGPDEKLYVPVGAPGNINDPNPETHAHIRRINPDGSGIEIVVRGVRNTVGFDWHPATKELYFTDNGRDWVSEDIPEDELNRVSASGKKHLNTGAEPRTSGILEPESDLHADLPVLDGAVDDLTADLGHLEPVEVTSVAAARAMPLPTAASKPSDEVPTISVTR